MEYAKKVEAIQGPVANVSVVGPDGRIIVMRGDKRLGVGWRKAEQVDFEVLKAKQAAIKAENGEVEIKADEVRVERSE